MLIAEFRIEPADFHADLEDLHRVRDAIFVDEQRIPPEIEWDEEDPDSWHVLARDVNHLPIGTGRLTKNGQLGRLAVLTSWRGRGVGKSLLSALLEKARTLNFTEVILDAQAGAFGFYQRFGFEKNGEPFEKAGISHQTLRLTLESAKPAPLRALKPPKTSVTAEKFDGFEGALEATTRVIADARKEISLYVPNLDYPLFRHPSVAAALKAFALQSREGGARIILHSPTALRGQGHPLVEFAQRLPSSFAFRMPVEPEDLQYSSSYLFNDQGGYVFRLFADRPMGVWSPVLPGRSRQLAEEFERCWQRCQVCTEFRVLSI